MSENYWKNLRCKYCNSKGQIFPVRKEEVRTEHGFGNITRTQVSETIAPDVYGKPVVAQHRSYTQERVPVIRTTYRMIYRCAQCHSFVDSREFTTETEDFLQGRTLSREVGRELVNERVVEKLTVTCKYCKNEVSTSNKKCPVCGAPIGS